MAPNVVLFSGTDLSGNAQLWETNGTAAGTFELTGIAGAPTAGGGLYPSNLTNYNGQVLFGGIDASGNIGLWVTDGTANGTHELAVAGALTTSQYPFFGGLNPTDLTVYNGYVFFAGDDASVQAGLWETNGTAAGTHELAVTGASSGPFSTGLSPYDLTVYNGYLYFSGLDASGLVELWETNGTAAGTHELTGVAGTLTTGQDTMSLPGFAPSDLTVFNDQLLFSGNDATGQTGLWESNGTAAGTQELTGIAGASNTGTGLDPTDLTIYNGEVLFRGKDSSGLYGLWATNGTAAGTHELTGIAGAQTSGAGFFPSGLTNYNGQLLFTACDSSGRYGLWVTNGTAAGTHELTGITGAQTSGVGLDPSDFTVYSGEVLFSGYDSSGKLGLWVTNGTVTGTRELTGVSKAAATGLAPTDLTAVGGPVLTAGASAEFVVGGPPVTLDAGLSVSDGESTSLIGATVSIGAGFLAGDALGVGAPQTGVASSYNAVTGVLTLSGAASLSTYQTELDSVTFASSTANSPSRTIAWLVNDGLTTSTPVNSSVSVVANPPVLTAGASAEFVVGGPPVTLDAGLSVSDGESTSLIGATVSIGAGFLAGDALSVGAPQTGVASSYNAVTGVLTLSGAASLSTYQTELDSVTFASSTANSPSRTVAWSVNDGLTTSTPVSSSVSVEPADLTALTPTAASDSILFRNSNGQAAIWSLTGTKVSSGGTVSPNPGPSWTEIGTGDFNDDGHSDILWQNSNGQAAVWEMNGSRLIGGGSVTPDPGPSWKAIGTGDFNDDGHSDILWQNSDGQAAVWDMNGSTLIGGGNVRPNPGASWKAIGTGDFNDDGHSDILWQNSDGQAAVWDMNGSTLIGGGAVTPNPGASWKVIGSGDFNHDGHSDILWQNTNGQVAIWEMNGNTLIGGGTVGINPGPSWHAIGTGGEGSSDILLQNTNGQTAIWEMNGTSITGGGSVSANAGPSWRAVGLS